MANAWNAFYWADYLADTGHLTLAQHGAYLLLMAHYYRTRRPLPANASVLHRVCRCTSDADVHAVEEVLAEFFTLDTLDGDVHRHKRIDLELAKAVDLSGKRRAAAIKRHHGIDANASILHPVCTTQSQPQSQAPPLSKESVFVLEENPRARVARETTKSYSQEDFDARDRRKLADAFKQIGRMLAAKVGSGNSRSEEEIVEWACEIAGISVQRGLEVQTSGKKWPHVQQMGASG